MVKRGCPGDASILKPTIMAAVPLMLDRIYKAINEKVNKGSPFTQKLFNWAYEYRYVAEYNFLKNISYNTYTRTEHEWRHPLLDIATTLISRNAEHLNKIPTY